MSSWFYFTCCANHSSFLRPQDLGSFITLGTHTPPRGTPVITLGTHTPPRGTPVITLGTHTPPRGTPVCAYVDVVSNGRSVTVLKENPAGCPLQVVENVDRVSVCVCMCVCVCVPAHFCVYVHVLVLVHKCMCLCMFLVELTALFSLINLFLQFIAQFISK